MIRSGSFAFRLAFASAAALAVTACGGGDGTPSPTPTPTPTPGPPVFTSASTVSVESGTTGTFYAATAVDPTGEALTFSITGGADEALFSITGNGALSFKIPPVYDPATGADNSYTVKITVTDGTNPVVMDLVVNVIAVNSDFRVRRVGVGFSQPVYVYPIADGKGRVFVVERTGRIRILDPKETSPAATTTFLDVSAEISTDGERGLLGFTTAPDFATSRQFYVFLTNATGAIEVRRYKTMADNADVADPASADVILQIPHPRNNHYGGWIGFGPDNFLYITTGDGGGAGDPDGNAQNKNSLLGKVLRIDPASDAYPSDANKDYAIPTANPFATSGGAPEVIAYGLRNPYRASIDFSTGNLVFGDVGQDGWEELNILLTSDKGANFGWPILEGTHVFKGGDTAGLIAPVAEYAHGAGATQGGTVVGGYIYGGSVSSLQLNYFFGDFVTGHLWSLPSALLQRGSTLAGDSFRIRTGAFVPDAGTINAVVSFGQDENRNLYIVDYDGEIFVVEAKRASSS